MHFKPSKCYYSLIFAELRGLCPLNPHQSSALDLLMGAFSTPIPPPPNPTPRPLAETDFPKLLLDVTLHIKTHIPSSYL